jgi:LysM repeat protein
MIYHPLTIGVSGNDACGENRSGHRVPARSAQLCATLLLCASSAAAQTSVVTQHYDIARTGANTNETILTPSNVNTAGFGKLFSQTVDGWVYAQPLYMPGVTMGAGTPQAGTTHNVVFIATEHDGVYAFDADSNTGANANPLWQVSLLIAAYGAVAGATTVPSTDVDAPNDIKPEIGITGTPVIDPSTNTLYVVGKTKESGTTYVQRLHALDITTGAEKFGGPKKIQASVTGTGSGSTGGVVTWDPLWENQRPGLLLLNGIVYVAFASHGDNTPWHGWILAYNAGTLQQTGAWCSSPNSFASGIWMSGSGLAAVVPDPVNHPFGQMFTTTGNGAFDAAAPYNNSMDYGDSIIKLDLAGGIPTMSGAVPGDDFTPHDQATLNTNDTDQASGGVLLLPPSAGGGQRFLVQAGKTGRVYVLNQNSLGGYHVNNTKDPGETAQLNGVYGMPAYWNGNVYYWSKNDHLKAFSFVSGVLSTSPTSTSAETGEYPGSTPTVSANGTTNGIVWDIRPEANGSTGREILYAHDATDVSKLLYSSELNVARDNPGNTVKFSVPTVINGKVYVGTEYQISVYGLLNGATQAASPAITPGSESFNSSVQVTMNESTSGANIYYTTDGVTTPTTSSAQYSGPITVTSTETIQAIAAGPGLLASAVASATYTLNTQVATPTFLPPPGTYSSAQSVAISTTTPNATIYYTLGGTLPTTSSTQYTGPVSISSSTTLQAIATASGLSNSNIASGAYAINQGSTAISFASGFSASGMQFNGHTKLNGTRLQLTDTGTYEAGSAFWRTPVNVQSFTNDFNFQLTNPIGNGITFTIQNAGITALGPVGGGLGYGPDSPGATPGIAKSVAIKFDLVNNAGEGNNSVGLYTNGASPTVPATTLGGGVNLHSGDVMQVHMNYDGTTLTMTITDTTNSAETFTTSWPINIPSTVGGNTAFVGFTGGTGKSTSIQEILTWSYSISGSSSGSKTPVVYQTANLPAASSGPTFRQFTWTGFPDATGTILDATNVGDHVTFTANVTTAGTYDIKVSAKGLNTRGMWQVAINGASFGAPQDEYRNSAAAGIYVVLDLGNFNFATAGNYSLKFTVSGKNAASMGYSISFDDITLTPQ